MHNCGARPETEMGDWRTWRGQLAPLLRRPTRLLTLAVAVSVAVLAAGWCFAEHAGRAGQMRIDRAAVLEPFAPAADLFLQR